MEFSRKSITLLYSDPRMFGTLINERLTLILLDASHII